MWRKGELRLRRRRSVDKGVLVFLENISQLIIKLIQWQFR